MFSAVAFGFATGFHCIGMCGPIALSMGMTKTQALKYQLQNIIYNLGRIVMYALLGAILGIVGKGFEVVGVQRYVTIAVGVMFVLMAIFSFGGKDFATKIPLLNKILLWIKMNLGKFLQRQNLGGRFITGLLNGLLPCGMVYVALTASLAMGGVWQGALYMFLFGVGTVPFMFAVVYFGALLTQGFRQKILKIVPILMLIMGGLFILRGLELGIPYLSPPKKSLRIKPEKLHQIPYMKTHNTHH